MERFGTERHYCDEMAEADQRLMRLIDEDGAEHLVERARVALFDAMDDLEYEYGAEAVRACVREKGLAE